MKKIFKIICSILLGDENQDHNFQTTIGIFIAKYFLYPVTNFYKEIKNIYKHAKRILFEKTGPEDLGLIKGCFVLLAAMIILIISSFVSMFSDGWKYLKNKYSDYKINLKDNQPNRTKKITV